MPSEGEGGAKHNSTDSTNLAESAVVPQFVGSNSRISSPPTTTQGHVKGPQRSASPSTVSEQAETSRLESIQQQHSAVGVSDQTSELSLTGWSRGTNMAYQSGWNKWVSWCQGRKVNPISCGVQPFLDFISTLFQEGLQYRSINSIRSAVSSTHQPIDGSPIGQHPLVRQLFRGVYNSRPPQPRYTHTWDVNTVLVHITQLGENKDLPLKALSSKLVVLIALTSASRVSELQALDLHFHYHKPNGVLFKLASLTKK